MAVRYDAIPRDNNIVAKGGCCGASEGAGRMRASGGEWGRVGASGRVRGQALPARAVTKHRAVERWKGMGGLYGCVIEVKGTVGLRDRRSEVRGVHIRLHVYTYTYDAPSSTVGVLVNWVRVTVWLQ